LFEAFFGEVLEENKMDKKFVISLIGAPASGKGYIASSLVNELKTKYHLAANDIKDISVGEMIRREKKANTPLGQELAANMKEGGLAPDSIVNKMLLKALDEVKAKVLILDGYPRTVGQVKAFDKLMENYSSAVIFRDTPKELILERVKNRRICEKCGKAHDVGDGVCPDCGGKLVMRKDDSVLPERLAEYEEMTKPAVIELKNEGKNFFWYEGTAEGEDIAESFLKANERYLA
jgi:adenylate kinase family enzyme